MTNDIPIPEGMQDRKDFRRILEMIEIAVADEVMDLAESIARTANPNIDITDDNAYEEWFEPLEMKLWDLIGKSFQIDPE